MDLFSKANEEFVAENYGAAIELYTQAIAIDDTRNEFYANRAHAHIKDENYKDAVNDADKAITLNPQNHKAYLRKGIACFHLGDYTSTKSVMEEGQKVQGSPPDAQFSTWIRKSEAEIDSQNKALGHGTDVDVGVSTVSQQNESTAAQLSNDNAKQTTSSVGLPMPTGAKTRYDWYQTETQVVITILLKKMKKEDVDINVQENSFSGTVKLPEGGDFSLELDLAHPVVADKTIVKVLSSKIEVKLKKQEGIRWNKLEGDPSVQDTKVKQFNPNSDTATDAAAHKYPSSSHYTRDWDKVVTEIKKEEKEEKPEGDAALNSLFQQIYSDGNDEVRKAMNKSFSESGGTVLSTNWKDIGTKKTDIKAPDGMEYKKYDA